VVGDPGDDRLLHGVGHPGPIAVVERRTDVDGHVVATADLDRTGHEDACTGGRHLQHLVEGDLVELARHRYQARVCGEHAVDVGVDLDVIGAQGRGQGDGGGVRATTAQGGDLLRLRIDTLEPGDDHDLPVLKRLSDPLSGDLGDAGLAVHRVGEHARLGSGVADGGYAPCLEGHGEQRHRDPLAG